MATDTPAVITPTITLNEEISAGVGIALSVTMILSFFIFFVSGSGLAVIVFWLVLILCVVILVTYGYLPSTLFATKKEPPPPAGSDTNDSSGYGLVGMEVFHIDNSTFTYDDAQAGCAAFGATLATLEQVNEAYNEGAEWCGYGWSAGGLALFPTQRATWESLQREVSPAKRTACGRVGVNGGYFDPASKFGLNCFGYKPAATKKMTFPTPPPGTDSTTFQAAVNRFQGMLSSFTVSPYSRQQWSGYGAMGSNASAAATYGSQFAQNLGGLSSGPLTVTESFTEDMRVASSDANILDANRPAGYTYIRNPANVERSSATVVTGGTGGAAGAAGATGGTGPTGPTGAAGAAGVAGAAGPTGASGVAGAAGAAGPAGPAGRDGSFPGKVPITDTRAVNLSPAEYYAKGMGKYNEFKTASVVGLPGGGYSEVETTVPWGDTTGGPVVQSTPTGLSRSGTTTWSSWTSGPVKISDRWSIQDEGGPLVFRDNEGPGDNRYAMFLDGGSGKNL